MQSILNSVLFTFPFPQSRVVVDTLCYFQGTPTLHPITVTLEFWPCAPILVASTLYPPCRVKRLRGKLDNLLVQCSVCNKHTDNTIHSCCFVVVATHHPPSSGFLDNLCPLSLPTSKSLFNLLYRQYSHICRILRLGSSEYFEIAFFF